MSLFQDTVLPVIQEINTYGGNFTTGFICRAVIDEIDRLADGGDVAMLERRARLTKQLADGTWPDDFQAFNSFFETYHECVFYIIASRKWVSLTNIPETTARKTPDFRTVTSPIEQFEVKTIDFSSGQYWYPPVTESGLASVITATEVARTRGVGIGVRTIRPHGDVTSNLEAIEKVMRQIGRNVQPGQFATAPTFLVLPMIRTNLRSGAIELCRHYFDPDLNIDVNGHLWTIAAHPFGDQFVDHEIGRIQTFKGILNRAGILQDFPFVRGIIFLHTEWSKLTDCDSSHPFPDEAFGLYGVWNDAWASPHGRNGSPPAGTFTQICDLFTSAGFVTS